MNTPESEYKVTLSMALVAGGICFLVFWRTLSCGFVSFDDQGYILNNSAIRGLDWNLLVWAFGPPSIDLWIPLTWLSFALDYYFWGLEPFGYHLSNNLLHSINAGMVVLIADQLLRDRLRAARSPAYLYPVTLLLSGLLFGIHPLRVESVAWVTERKDVLNGFFSFASILFYLRYARKRATEGKGYRLSYALSLLLFSLSLLAKPISVILPVIFIIADHFQFNRLAKGRCLPVLIEKIPFIAAAFAVTITTLHFFARKQLLAPHESFTITKRILVSGNAVFEYCRLMICPVGIIPLHITPEQIPFSYAVKTIAVLLFFAAVLFAGKWRQEIPAVWLCFVIPMLPVLAFFQAGDQAFASRYTYIPAVVPSIAVAAVISNCYSSIITSRCFQWKMVAVTAVILVTGVYSVMTVRLIDIWHDSGTLWSRQIAFQPIGRAFNARGYFYMQSGMYAEAVNDFTRAIEIIQSRQELSEDNVLAFRGEALRKLGRYAEAFTDFTAAIALYPHRAYYYHRALVLQSLGKMKEAEQDFAIAGDETGPIEWFADE